MLFTWKRDPPRFVIERIVARWRAQGDPRAERLESAVLLAKRLHVVPEWSQWRCAICGGRLFVYDTISVERGVPAHAVCVEVITLAAEGAS